MNRGDVLLAHFPFTDASDAKLRPVLVVSNTQMNSGEDIVVLPISSRPEPNDQFCIYIGDSEYRAAGLRQESSIKWAKPATISKAVISRRLGVLPESLLEETCNKLCNLFQG